MVDLTKRFSVAEKLPTLPELTTQDIILIGGGHTHVQVLKSFGMSPPPGVRLTLIAKELSAPYSGMLPGLIAGHYDFDDCHIDLVRLAQFAGARIIHGTVDGINRVEKRISITGRPSLRYDIASIDVGITPDLSALRGAETHGIAVKPISSFWPKWQALEQHVKTETGPRRITLIGGGAAGCELALAADHRLRTVLSSKGREAVNLTITLITGGSLLPTHNRRAQTLMRKALQDRNIHVVESGRAVEVSEKCVKLDSGLVVPSDAALITTGAAPPSWFATSDLKTTHDGFLAIRDTLQMPDDPHIFAVGDCATSLTHPREKSGVFAVRQGPTLIENLTRVARAEEIRAFKPQKYFLTLLSLADGRAIAAKGSLAFSGRWAWKLKDVIDRKFMRKFNDLPKMSEDETHDSEDMRCGGCAAKVGPVTLANALQRLGLDVADAPDDAAIIDDSGPTLKLQSIDFFRSFWPDPFVLGEIAANHALNDIYAMGGTPRRALALAVLPFGKPQIVEEDLYQLLAGARRVFERENVELAGGHSGEGRELAVGFSVSGEVERATLTQKSGLRSGNALILTKPIGTGIAFAAHMRGAATAHTVAAAINVMRQSNRAAVNIIKKYKPTGITDITGFGLAGHVIEMLRASRASAKINVSHIPVLPGAGALARAGHASTLLEQNLALASHIAPNADLSASDAALLFDPQTSGGLLAGVDKASALNCVSELEDAGYDAAIIGSVSDMTLQQLALEGAFNSTDTGVDIQNDSFSDQRSHHSRRDKSRSGIRTAR